MSAPPLSSLGPAAAAVDSMEVERVENVAAPAESAATEDALSAAGVPFEELSAAAFGGNEELVRELLRAGASPTARDVTGLTALHRAAIGGHAAIVTALLSVVPDTREAANTRDKVRGRLRARVCVCARAT